MTEGVAGRGVWPGTCTAGSAKSTRSGPSPEGRHETLRNASGSPQDARPYQRCGRCTSRRELSRLVLADTAVCTAQNANMSTHTVNYQSNRLAAGRQPLSRMSVRRTDQLGSQASRVARGGVPACSCNVEPFLLMEKQAVFLSL